ncbi:MAG: alkaline phosphatase family protein [bacterium]|nr:alkaline phosphatase family protein [bacterium]
MGNPVPSYEGDNLVNLLAELEIRLTGRSPTRGLRADLADLIPHKRNYVLLINDGLGARQLAHPGAGRLRRFQRAVLKAPFPTTTVVGLSSVATAMAPMQHGLVGFTQWIPARQRVVNMMFWEDLEGNQVDYDPASFLPTPNLWERLAAAGINAVIIRPSRSLNDSPLSKMLYRGAQRHGYSSLADVNPSALLDDTTRTLVVVYLSPVDGAAHRHGQQSVEHRKALKETSGLWKRLTRSIPSETALIGTADHGHCDIPQNGKNRLGTDFTQGMVYWGDGRVLMFRGPTDQIRLIAEQTSALYVDPDRLRKWLGGGDAHPALEEFPTAALLAAPGTVILPQHIYPHEVGHHGGITPQELLIPLIIA